MEWSCAEAGHQRPTPEAATPDRAVRGLAGLAAAWAESAEGAGDVASPAVSWRRGPAASTTASPAASPVVAARSEWLEESPGERQAAVTGLESLLAFTASLEQVLLAEAALHGIEVPR
jgi:hypothetical protein